MPSRRLALVAFLFCLLSSASTLRINRKLLKSDVILSHVRVGVRRYDLAIQSLHFPAIVPLLFANSIQSFVRVGPHYTLHHSKKRTTHVYPLRRRNAANRRVGGFTFKESTLGSFPVPMENVMVLARLVPDRPRNPRGRARHGNAAWLHLWVVSHGVYTRLQKRRQRFFTDAFVRDLADNAQRNLGVAFCRHTFVTTGLCNHKKNALFGSSVQPMFLPFKQKRPPSADMDGMTPRPRDVSNSIFKMHSKARAPHDINMLFVIFGQFFDHEIVATPKESEANEAFVPVLADGGVRMAFTRSGSLKHNYAKCCAQDYAKNEFWKGPPFNDVTPLVDGSAIYGAHNLRAMSLRSFTNGLLITKRLRNEDYLPLNHPHHLLFKQDNEPTPDMRNMFVAGDVRANENAILLAMHTIMVRHHNAVARAVRRHVLGLRKRRLANNDDWLFNAARKIVVAQLQVVVFEEFVPAMLGPNALGVYKGYNRRVDPRISVFHSGFAFRFGHSGIQEHYRIRTRDGQTKHRLLRDLFFHPERFLEHGVDNLLEAAIRTAAADVDEQMIDSLRSTLFNPKKGDMLDLAALNLQRMRDLGIPGYLEVQKMFGSGTGLDNIDPALQKRLLATFGSADKIDPFTGGLCERKVKGSLLGPLFHKVNVEQFRRLRDGDRFYYKIQTWDRVLQSMPMVKRVIAGDVSMADFVFGSSKLHSKNFRRAKELFRKQ